MGKKRLLDLDEPIVDESGILEIPTVIPPTPVGPMRDRQNTLTDDDLTEQARLASVLIDSTPPRAPDPSAEMRTRLERLAPLERIPSLARRMSELGGDLKDPKTAFVAGFVDSILPLETIIEVTGLPEAETIEILDRLVTQGAIVFPPRR